LLAAGLMEWVIFKMAACSTARAVFSFEQAVHLAAQGCALSKITNPLIANDSICGKTTELIQ